MGGSAQICKGSRVLQGKDVVSYPAKFCSLHTFNYQFNFKHWWRKWCVEGCGSFCLVYMYFFIYLAAQKAALCVLTFKCNLGSFLVDFFHTGRHKVSIVICKSRGILSASLQIIKLWRSNFLLSLHLYHPTDFGNYQFYFHLPSKLSQTSQFPSKLHVPVKERL